MKNRDEMMIMRGTVVKIQVECVNVMNDERGIFFEETDTQGWIRAAAL